MQAKADTADAARRRIAALLAEQPHLIRKTVLGDTAVRSQLQALDAEVTALQASLG